MCARAHARVCMCARACVRVCVCKKLFFFFFWGGGIENFVRFHDKVKLQGSLGHEKQKFCLLWKKITDTLQDASELHQCRSQICRPSKWQRQGSLTKTSVAGSWQSGWVTYRQTCAGTRLSRYIIWSCVRNDVELILCTTKSWKAIYERERERERGGGQTDWVRARICNVSVMYLIVGPCPFIRPSGFYLM